MSRFLLGVLIAAALVATVPGLSAKFHPHRPIPLADETVAGPDGRELFAREWVPHAPDGPGGDGLGPLFNDSSCAACHNQGGVGGAGPRAKNVRIVTPVGGTTPNGPPPMIGPSFVFHRFSTDPDFAAWAQKEGITADQSRRHVRLGDMAGFGGGFKGITERNTTSLFGAGLIDAVPVAVLAEASVRRFPEYPEVIGRVGRGADGQVGRFGWKAQIGRLDEFVLTACAVELGLQVPGKDQPKLPHRPEYAAPGLDLTAGECAALTEYVRRLPAPPRLEPTTADHRAYLDGGAKAFTAIGCATCHTPKLGDVNGIYSDLLLHDLGPSLSDASSSYGTFQSPGSGGGPGRVAPVIAGANERATAAEWRTPPLWGVRDSAPYLHDGRTDTLEDAILAHGGQAERARAAFQGLPPADKSKLVAFLKSLGAPAD